MSLVITGDRLPVRRATFLGSKQLGLSIFRSLQAMSNDVAWEIIHPNDLDDPRSVFPQWEQAADEFGVHIHISTSKAETKEMLRECDPDIAFLCGWYQLLDGAALDMIRFGAWGVHNSILPKYRGGSPLTWSIIQGDEIVGSSVFQLSNGIDAGRILHQIRVRNGPSDDISSILQKIEVALLNELPAQWLALLEGTAQLSEQDESEATYSGQRGDSDGLIDWTMDALFVHNFIRAQSFPYPCAFTFLGDNRLRILRSRLNPGVYFGTPGQVLRRQSERGGVLVSTGNNSALELLIVRRGEHAETASAAIPSTSCRLGRRDTQVTSSGN